MEKEYIVGLNRGVDATQFNLEMIQKTGSGKIPNREINVANQRPVSKRITHYMLTDEEAEQLKLDPRVYCVEIPPEQREDVVIQPGAIQESSFTKTTLDTGTFVNWGLRRMIETSDPYTGDTVTGPYTYHLDGNGVDVVIQDSGIQADHPEFTDAAGNSRVQQIDWASASGLSFSQSANHYRDYDGHGTHCAGIAAGKTYGWAKGARIYAQKISGLEGSGDGGTGISTTYAFDSIKEWHRRKNNKFTPTGATYIPSTGVLTLTIGTHPFSTGDKIRIATRSLVFTCAKDEYKTLHSYPRGGGVPNATGTDPFYNKEIEITNTTSTTITMNIGISSDTTTHRFVSAEPGAVYTNNYKFRPTVINMSWGYVSSMSNITGGNYRGTPWTGSSKRTDLGMVGDIFNRHAVRIASVDVDIQEMVDEGIVICTSAGNYSQKIDVVGGADYNNYWTSALYGNTYYHRGGSPSDDEIIVVGNIDSNLNSNSEQKASSSETGPGVDVYAPGTNIMSATSTINKFADGDYPQDSNFKICNISGTSMASPQIVGIVALYLQLNPEATPAEAKAWVIDNSVSNALYSPGDGTTYTNNRSLLGGNNRFAYNKFNSRHGLTLTGKPG
jgi:subtilisin family serine protease